MAKIIPFPPVAKINKLRRERNRIIVAEIIKFPVRKPTLTERILMSANK